MLLSVFLNDGRGGLIESGPMEIFGAFRSLDAGDVTGDGRLDLVLAAETFFHFQSCVAVFEGAGDGSFAEVQRVPWAYPRAALWDADGDGDLDVVGTGRLGAEMPSSVGILLNDGTGRLGGLIEIGSEDATAAAVAADLDGDGKVDLAVLNYGSHEIA
ncbi:MAG: VCBS repeat-containing protein, partial [Planctomycetes bacterium]|nr:VCBS repeat-containing protein [Planctomycetota bacterium]